MSLIASEYSLANQHPEHRITLEESAADAGLWHRCSCGCAWKFWGAERLSTEHMCSIYQSHLAYFRRPAIQVL
jgi:hypothetical protein